ncbi:MAG: adenosyl-hopene transferase HpnH [Gemmatimonadetes bacterium]|nr:adenosyl-hopene transferase HpnH [Gemmatimonadota bacterium]NIR78571.1 adenosyl-hopene transferase HpnH [Gemmatimonadota bacterium]NIT86572.1 adenosyl-hopene transferase HpnH [Gemmatimonadota bacterium]NIU31025.1 adenosyl-hopene transferase HpnH [Gemmatimonadota bacterium]NIU35779.1 adenosyl-hopene transferase HpnH [Gemmatimonadota bacterium]
MRFPAHITFDMLKQQARTALDGNDRFPMVLMLEPLWTCNLACIGCTPERHTGHLKDRLDLETCFEAADDCGAPLVSICGGEPTVYPELKELVDGLIARKRHIYLCTNALLLDKRVFGKIEPDKRLTINVHLDGMQKTHDYVVDREGVYEKAIEMIKESKARGYHTIINTTVYKETEIDEVEELCEHVTDLGIDGILISPGYHYEKVDRDIFLTRQDIEEKFQRVLEFSDRFPFTSSPPFLEFAAGMREYDCSPWSTVTFTPRGWKRPCYLLDTEGYTWDWDEFWNGTDWDYWESRQDERCQNCAMHSGFEASAVSELHRKPADIVKMAKWHLTG